MKIEQFTLPNSGYIVDLNTEPSFSEFDELENFLVYNAKSTYQSDGSVLVSGEIIKNQKAFMFEVFVKGIKDKSGSDLGSISESIGSLGFEDGLALEARVEEIKGDIKKKLKKKE